MDKSTISSPVSIAPTTTDESVKPFQYKIPSNLREFRRMEANDLRDFHDDWNIIFLSILSVLSVASLLYIQSVWIRSCLTYLTIAYIGMDALWIYNAPASVKSASTVLGHHVATLIILVDPLTIPSHRCYTAPAMIVEVNTLLLILRRRFTMGDFIEVLFALTWIVIRIFWYPLFGVYLSLSTFPQLGPHYAKVFREMHAYLEPAPQIRLMQSTLAMWVIICSLQLWWSIPLAKGWIRRLTSKNNIKADKFL